MIDLLKLWLLGTEQLSIQNIASAFNVSTKQAARKLKQFEQQGWITYLPGKGRGKKSRITWHKNVEEVVQQNIADPEFRLNLIKQMNVDLLSETFVTSIMSQLFSTDQHVHCLKIPIYNTELKTDPLQLLDTESAWVMMHVYSRLVDENGCGDLAYHWEQRGDQFVFYIRPSIYWHTGEMMTIEQIVASLENSYQHVSYNFARSKLKQLAYEGNCIVFHYVGELEELLKMLAQVEFSIRYEQFYAGPYILDRVEADQYELRVNPHYYLAKPILKSILLQTIPSKLIRKISLMNAPHKWSETLEHGGTFYLYYKAGLSQKEQQELADFFTHFANEVTKIDCTKIPVHQGSKTAVEIPEHLNVGYVVNKPQFVELLQVLSNTIHVTHLTVEDIQDAKNLETYDCIVVPFYEESGLPTVHTLDDVFSNRLPLYTSYHKIFYPKGFIRKGRDIFGYPNLKESYVIDYEWEMSKCLL